MQTDDAPKQDWWRQKKNCDWPKLKTVRGCVQEIGFSLKKKKEDLINNFIKNEN